MSNMPLSDKAIVIGLIAFGVYWFVVYGANQIFHVHITQDDFTNTISKYIIGIGGLSLGSGIIYKLVKWKLF